MLKKSKRHLLLVETGRMLNQCRGCKVWQKAKRHSHNPDKICVGCVIYCRLKEIGNELDNLPNRYELAECIDRQIQYALLHGYTRYWCRKHIHAGEERINRIYRKMKVNGY